MTEAVNKVRRERRPRKTKKQPRVLMFSTPSCSFCNKAKRYFRQKGVRFLDIDVSPFFAWCDLPFAIDHSQPTGLDLRRPGNGGAFFAGVIRVHEVTQTKALAKIEWPQAAKGQRL